MPLKKKSEVPKPLRPYVDLGFNCNEEISDQWRGDCLLCGKENKLYVATADGRFSCKAGICSEEGNVFTMLRLLVSKWAEEQDQYPKRWEKLSKERSLPIDALQDGGLLWADQLDRWIIPLRNNEGKIVQLEQFNPYVTKESKHVRIRPTAGLDHALYGAEELGDKKKKNWPVWVVEGHWDRIALKELFKAAGIKAVVVAVPGNNVFKDKWVSWLAGRDVVLCYDNDVAGIRGRNKAWRLLGAHCSVQMVEWPSELDEGYDVRDFYKQGGDAAGLTALVEPYSDTLAEEKTEVSESATPGNATIIRNNWPLLSSGKRPTLDETIGVYERTMKLTPDLRDALRVIFAVLISNQLEQDSPLWAHIAGPPGSGKTLLIMSCSEVENTVFMSTITANTLVSGFVLPGGKDPSLLPLLYGKTFVLKDFTEILSLAKPNKDKIYAHLRGAYDGLVQERFGNGSYRDYKGYFSMVTGVTPRIFGEQTAELGERFLIFHMGKTTQEERYDVIKTAVQSTNNQKAIDEIRMRSEAAKAFLEYRIEPADVPRIDDYVDRIIGLSELVSYLRATVQKDETRDGAVIRYRPEPELGTRIAKQLAKLLLGLGLQRYPAVITEDDYRIVARVAVNSCIGWNVEMVRALMGEGATLKEIVEKCNIPQTTVWNHIEQLQILGVVTSETLETAGIGRKPFAYRVSDDVQNAWIRAGFSEIEPPVTVNPLAKKLRSVKQKTVSSNGKVKEITKKDVRRFTIPNGTVRGQNVEKIVWKPRKK